jgi:hypothetical protein
MIDWFMNKARDSNRASCHLAYAARDHAPQVILLGAIYALPAPH